MKRNIPSTLIAAVLLTGLISAGAASKSGTSTERAAAKTQSTNSSAETTNQRISVKNSNVRISGNEFSGKMRRREEDIEDLERKLADAKAGSRRYLMLKQQRDKMALEMIHDIQNYLHLRTASDSDARMVKMRDMLSNEIRVITPKVRQIEDFPFPDRMDDMPGLVRDIQAGKVKYPGRIAKNESLMIKEIQREQTRALQEYHRQELKR